MIVKDFLKFPALIALVLSVFSLSVTDSAYANTSTNLAPVDAKYCSVTDLPKEELKLSKLIKSKDGSKVYELKNPEMFIKELGLKPPHPDAKLVGVSYTNNATPVQSTTTTNNDFTAQIGTGYYTKTTRTSTTCGTSYLRSSFYPGPATATMSINQGYSASYTANVGVSAEVVSAGVGFSVTSTFNISDTYSVYVPSGEMYNIVAYPKYLTKSFEVWNDPWIGSDNLVGSGTAYQPSGVCFVLWK